MLHYLAYHTLHYPLLHLVALPDGGAQSRRSLFKSCFALRMSAFNRTRQLVKDQLQSIGQRCVALCNLMRRVRRHIYTSLGGKC